MRNGKWIGRLHRRPLCLVVGARAGMKTVDGLSTNPNQLHQSIINHRQVSREGDKAQSWKLSPPLIFLHSPTQSHITHQE